MADLKLSQTTAAGTLTGAELAYVVQGGNSRRTTVGAIANLATATNLTYDQATRLLSSSTGTDVTLSLATDTLPGLMAAGDKARIDQLGADDSPSFTGLTITGTAAVTIPHIHGDLAGAVYIHVKNSTANTLAKGAPVYPTGTVGDTTTLEVAGADSSNPNLLPAVGLLADALAPNASGHAVIAGELTGLNTAGYAIGDALYVASGGGLTATRPTTGTIQQVAIVGRVNSGTGSATVTISTEISPNWDTAYNQRLRWDGGATGLNAATGRASLELGSLATQSGTFSGTSSGTNTGDVTLAASVADVLSLVGQELQADDPGADRLLFWDDSEGKLRHLELGSNLSITGTTLNATGGGGGIGDGDKGDITVSASGTTWTIDAGAVSYAKIQDVSATDRILGRSSAGAGPVQEIVCTAAGRALLDDVNAAAQLITLGAEQAGAAAAAQAAAVQRANHTGTQLAATISDFSAAVAALGTTVGNALRSLVNPSAVSFLRINADNSVTARSASEMRGDLQLTSAATATIGTAAGNLVALDGSARLPAVDGSQLTGLPTAPVTSVAGRTGAITLAVGDVANAVATNDARLSDARTPLAHNQAWSTITGTPTTLAGYGITDAFNPAIPGPIGGTTPAAGTFTALVATTRLGLPSGAPASPAARDLYAVGNLIAYRDSSGVERFLLNGADNLANLGNRATARSNLDLGTAATAATTDFVSATATTAANLVFAGPASGAAGARTFRALVAADLPAGIGSKTLARFTARDNQPPATAFATLNTRNSIAVLEFDDTTQESSNFISVIPNSANLSSGLLVRIWWMGATATSGNVRWGASFEASGTDMDADSFDTVTQVTSAANATSGIESIAEITCTAIDSLTAGQRFRIRITRIAADAVNDTMTGDSQLVAVEVQGVA